MVVKLQESDQIITGPVNMQILMAHLCPHVTIRSSGARHRAVSLLHTKGPASPIKTAGIVCRAAMTSKEPSPKTAGKPFDEADLGTMIVSLQYLRVLMQSQLRLKGSADGHVNSLASGSRHAKAALALHRMKPFT